jgi:hypothetical protein
MIDDKSAARWIRDPDAEERGITGRDHRGERVRGEEGETWRARNALHLDLIMFLIPHDKLQTQLPSSLTRYPGGKTDHIGARTSPGNLHSTVSELGKDEWGWGTAARIAGPVRHHDRPVSSIRDLHAKPYSITDGNAAEIEIPALEIEILSMRGDACQQRAASQKQQEQPAHLHDIDRSDSSQWNPTLPGMISRAAEK